MRSVKLLSAVVAVGTVLVLLALNWHAQRETQRKLDTLIEAVSARPPEPAPPTPPAPPPPPIAVPPAGAVPRELSHVTMPPYIIEAPDVLVMDTVRAAPLPGYRLEPLDVLAVEGKGREGDKLHHIDPDGAVDLGAQSGGKVRVAGQTVPEAERTIREKVGADVRTTLAQFGRLQQINGEHIVRPDGTIGLGSYGSVQVSGLTLPQAKGAVEAHLKKYLDRPEVTIDVRSMNSYRYYVITTGVGIGDQVYPFPLTGRETVLDAVANVHGLPETAVRGKIWLARRGPAGAPFTTLDVDWKAITQLGDTRTNYQLLAGDRVHISATPD